MFDFESKVNYCHSPLLSFLVFVNSAASWLWYWWWSLCYFVSWSHFVLVRQRRRQS